MEVKKVKARHELEGRISGDVYLVIEYGVRFYYLVNILDSNDIYIIKQPKSERVKQNLSAEEIPESLKIFHEERAQLDLLGKKATTELIRETIKVKLEARLEAEREARRKAYEDEIRPYFVYDTDATEHLLAELGKNYTEVKNVYSGRGKYVYIIDEKWKFIIEKPYCRPQYRNYTVMLIEDERREFKEKVKGLMSKTNMPYGICQIYANKLPETEVLKVLSVIEQDRMEGEWKDRDEGYRYFWHLQDEVGNWRLDEISENKKEVILNYVCGKNNNN